MTAIGNTVALLVEYDPESLIDRIEEMEPQGWRLVGPVQFQIDRYRDFMQATWRATLTRAIPSPPP